MALLTDSEAQQVKEMLAGLRSDVHISLYTQKLECPSCSQTQLIVSELESLSDRLRVERLNPLTDRKQARVDNVTEVPAIIISDGTHSRVRFYGTPSGFEFTSLLTTIMDTGTDKVTLEENTIDYLQERLERDLDIMVFVTPSCPHCPRAVVLAHRLAMGSQRVTSSAIEAGEFPELAGRFGVQGVPRTVINDTFFVEGAMPESQMIEAIAKALTSENPDGKLNLLDYLQESTGGRK